jgi:hypothetical protein
VHAQVISLSPFSISNLFLTPLEQRRTNIRLINVLTQKLEIFNDPGQKLHAILPHQGEGDEVTFQETQDLGIAKKKTVSFSKIEATCRTAFE